MSNVDKQTIDYRNFSESWRKQKLNTLNIYYLNTRILSSLFLLFAFCVKSFAQDFKRNTVYFTQGVSFIVNKDLYRSPYVYTGANYLSELGVLFQRKKMEHSFNVSYSAGNIQTEFSPPAKNRMLTLNYRLLFTPFQKESLSFSVGPGLEVFGWYVDYFPEIKTSKVSSDLLAVSLKVKTRINFKISKRSSANIEGSFPLLNYVDRPNFLDRKTRINDFGILNLVEVKGRINYTYSLSERLSILAFYQSDYLYYKRPAAARLLRNNLGIGILVHL